MPVFYRIMQRFNPNKPTEPKKYYAVPTNTGEVNIRHLAEKISQQNSFSVADVIGLIEALLQVIIKEIKDGKIVRLGEFGSFYLTIHSKGEAKEKDVDEYSITGNSLRFMPGVLVKYALKIVDYRKKRKI